jgi:hypothetical protein
MGSIPLLPIAVGLGILAVIMNKDTIVTAASKAFDFAKVAAFRAALPSGVGQYAQHIINAAQSYGVDPFALAVIMYNESRGGNALKPTGQTGTGDFIPRKPGASTYKYANPATGLPPDGKGWGRGLMQIDYGVHNAWATSSPWWDAQANINKGAEVLAEKFRYFKGGPGSNINVESWRVLRGNPDIWILPWATKYPRPGAWPTTVRDVRPLSGQQLTEAAIAAYNVSYTGVLQALGLGLPAEAGTTRQDYVSKFLGLIAGWRMAYDKIAGNV